MHDGMLRTTQVIAGSLVLGMLGFAAVVVFLLLTGQGGVAGTQPDLLGVLGPAVAAAWGGGFIVQMLVWTSQRSAAQREWAGGRLGEGQLAGRYQQLMIVRYALLEGAALLGIVTTLLTGSWLAMAAPAASVLVMAAIFPSRGRWEDFVEGAKRGG